MPAGLPSTPDQDAKAVLCADVEGYTRLIAKNEVQASERVSRMIRLFQVLVADYGGVVTNIAGDGVLALFGDVAQAARFAVDVQREFENEAAWYPNGDRIAFRIGINVGPVIVRDSNLHGHCVNIAARVQVFAPPGGICTTAAVRDSLEGHPGFQFRSLGMKLLKNVDEPVEVFLIEATAAKPSTVELRAPAPAARADDLQGGSITVLPLENLTGAPGDEHLCSGITREIISNLTRFRDLFVIAPHSAFIYRRLGISPADFARQIGARYICSGSLERRGAKLRIRIQLTEVSSGRVLWAERFDGQLAEVFAFEEEVTDMVAARVAIHINAAERRRIQSAAIPDLRAYGLILRGQDLSIRFRRESNLHARRLFEQAADLDHNYARCYAGISRTFNLGWRYRWETEPVRALDTAVDLAHAAIDRDAMDARGFGELGYACLYRKQHDESLAAYERALELNPNDADLLAEMGDALVYAGRAEESVRLIERAMRLNPYFPDWYLWYLGDASFHLEQYEKTITVVSKMRDQAEAHRLLAASYGLLGNTEKAREHARSLLQVHPDFSIEHWKQVPPYQDRHHLEPFIEGLRRAGLQ